MDEQISKDYSNIKGLWMNLANMMLTKVSQTQNLHRKAIYMTHQGWASPCRQETGWWLPGKWGRKAWGITEGNKRFFWN